jgi:hypothetical protein
MKAPQLTGHEKQFPTWGDLAREQLRRRGIPYFADIQAEFVSRLARLSPTARKGFALACAERLMKWHERLAKPEQRPFTLGWRPVLDVMWLGMEGQCEEAPHRVNQALEEFHASPFDHDEGQDGPDDADEDAAAACICAAECFVKGDALFACGSASRAIDLAFRIANEELHLDPNDFVWDPSAELMPLAQEAMHPAVQAELRRQLSDLQMLERSGMTVSVLQKLRENAG